MKLLDGIPLEKISISLFLFFLACFIFLTDTLCGVPESLLIISYFLFLFTIWYTFIFFYLPSNVEAVPIFLVLFLTPGCNQQYLPLNPSFHLLSFSHPLLSFPLTSSLPLVNPHTSRYIVTLTETHFSCFSSLTYFFYINSSFYP